MEEYIKERRFGCKCSYHINLGNTLNNYHISSNEEEGYTKNYFSNSVYLLYSLKDKTQFPELDNLLYKTGYHKTLKVNFDDDNRIKEVTHLVYMIPFDRLNEEEYKAYILHITTLFKPDEIYTDLKFLDYKNLSCLDLNSLVGIVAASSVSSAACLANSNCLDYGNIEHKYKEKDEIQYKSEYKKLNNPIEIKNFLFGDYYSTIKLMYKNKKYKVADKNNIKLINHYEKALFFKFEIPTTNKDELIDKFEEEYNLPSFLEGKFNQEDPKNSLVSHLIYVLEIKENKDYHEIINNIIKTYNPLTVYTNSKAYESDIILPFESIKKNTIFGIQN